MVRRKWSRGRRREEEGNNERQSLVSAKYFVNKGTDPVEFHNASVFVSSVQEGKIIKNQICRVQNELGTIIFVVGVLGKRLILLSLNQLMFQKITDKYNL